MAPVTALSRLRAIARAHPDASALVAADGRTWTYAQLIRAASGLAGALRDAGARPGDRIALHVTRSAEWAIGVWAIWSAGATLVPIDGGWPAAHKRALIARAAPRVALGAPLDALPHVPIDRRSDWDEPTEVVEAGEAVEAGEMREPGEPDAPAWLIFTSGSTGRPKGVVVGHGGVPALLDAQIPAFRLGPGARNLAALSIGFDASLSDLTCTHTSGATLVIAPPEALRDTRALLDVIGDRRITHADLPPSLLPLIAPVRLPGSLQTVVIGGEPCPVQVARAWAQRVYLVNVYGPTEATICTSLGAVDPDRWDRPRLGRPIAGTAYSVRDAAGRALPAGEPGELYIAGASLARGYLDDPELDAARFPTIDGARWFRTGDRVVALADGDYAFLGRIDRMRKIRGQLVEPEEVERHLMACAGVARCAVVETAARPGALAAFVELAGEARVTAAALRDQLARRLPGHMVPARFAIVDALPALDSGKPDLAALAAGRVALSSALANEPPSSRASARSSESRAGDAERAAWLAELWSEVLGCPVGVHDDLDAAGRDSYATLVVLARADERGLILDASAVGLAATCAEIAALGALDACPVERLAREADSVNKSINSDNNSNNCKSKSFGDIETARGEVGGAIAVTGATGFFGAALCAALLANTRDELICLVRSQRGEPGEARADRAARDADAQRRLDAALAAYGIPAGRARALAGDLESPRLGLDAQTWDALCQRADRVVHCAARVSLVASRQELWPANVAGTAEVLRLCTRGRAKRLHHISTLSVLVCSDRPPGLIPDGAPLPDTGRIHGGYAQSKWAAERLVASAGIPVAIHRLGLLVGDTQTGASAGTDQLSRFLRGLAVLDERSLRLATESATESAIDSATDSATGSGQPPLAVNLTPVDVAARASTRLIERDASGIFHVVSPANATLDQLVAAIARAPRAAAVHRDACDARDDRADAAIARLSLIRARRGASHRHAADLFLSTGVTYDVSQTLAALGPGGSLAAGDVAALVGRLVDGLAGRPVGDSS